MDCIFLIKRNKIFLSCFLHYLNNIIPNSSRFSTGLIRNDGIKVKNRDKECPVSGVAGIGVIKKHNAKNLITKNI